jgi:hypothetical protein
MITVAESGSPCHLEEQLCLLCKLAHTAKLWARARSRKGLLALQTDTRCAYFFKNYVPSPFHLLNMYGKYRQLMQPIALYLLLMYGHGIALRHVMIESTSFSVLCQPFRRQLVVLQLAATYCMTDLSQIPSSISSV